MKKLGLIVLIAAAALVLAGCTQNIHGGGVVILLEGYLNDQPIQPGTASIGLNFICNDHKDTLSGTLAWNDQTNGVQFNARLPWTALADYFGFAVTCDDLAAVANERQMSNDIALINTQGQQTGVAGISVAKPGADPICGTSVSRVTVTADFNSDGYDDYYVVGCLDRGKIVFQ